MEFEFDYKKSESNERKHGFDFYEAQKLWDDTDFTDIPVRTSDEPRFMVIGKIPESIGRELLHIAIKR